MGSVVFVHADFGAGVWSGAFGCVADDVGGLVFVAGVFSETGQGNGATVLVAFAGERGGRNVGGVHVVVVCFADFERGIYFVDEFERADLQRDHCLDLAGGAAAVSADPGAGICNFGGGGFGLGEAEF